MKKIGRDSFLQKKAAAMGWPTTLTKEIRVEDDFSELIERWREAKTLGDMLSVIHRLFEVEPSTARLRNNYDEIDRLIFCFIIADGWADRFSLRLPEDDRESRRRKIVEGRIIFAALEEMRQEVARKAFDALCLNFFKKTGLWKNKSIPTDGFAWDWEAVVASERLFPVIQSFFRVEIEDENVSVCNLSDCSEDRRPHAEGLAIQFLLNLARFMWGWNEACCHRSYFFLGEKEVKKEEYLSVFRACLDKAKPWMIEVLNYLGKLDVLREWIIALDETSLAKLREIAKRSKLGSPYFQSGKFPYVRPVDTLEEACLVSSPAAWLLKEYGTKTREHNRLMAIREAQREKDEADRKLKKLTGKQE